MSEEEFYADYVEVHGDDELYFEGPLPRDEEKAPAAIVIRLSETAWNELVQQILEIVQSKKKR